VHLVLQAEALSVKTFGQNTGVMMNHMQPLLHTRAGVKLDHAVHLVLQAGSVSTHLVGVLKNCMQPLRAQTGDQRAPIDDNTLKRPPNN
jgi:hypothetical protein